MTAQPQGLMERRPMKTATKKTAKRTRTRLKPEHRRKLIVEAAFKAIARDGFEGLRTRDIAEQIGINSATLHHYFPTKEDLIAGVADHLESRLRSEKSPARHDHLPPALAAFDDQFKDVVFYQMEKPDILAVYREFVARAPRDPDIRALVERLHSGWRTGIAEALRCGQKDGSLRADIDPEAAAGLVLSTAWGLVSSIFTSTNELDAAARQLKSLLVPKP
jgi:AcrR family transcriptional regulator